MDGWTFHLALHIRAPWKYSIEAYTAHVYLIVITPQLLGVNTSLIKSASQLIPAHLERKTAHLTFLNSFKPRQCHKAGKDERLLLHLVLNHVRPYRAFKTMEDYIAIFLANFSTTLATSNCNTDEKGVLRDNTQEQTTLDERTYPNPPALRYAPLGDWVWNFRGESKSIQH